MIRKFGLRKHGQSERAKAIRKLDNALSQLIRARDRSCITCGRGDVPLDAGHFRRRECMTTRFDYRNVAGKKLFKLSKTEKHWTIGELDQLTGAAKRSYLGYTTLYDQLSPRLDSLHPSAV